MNKTLISALAVLAAAALAIPSQAAEPKKPPPAAHAAKPAPAHHPAARPGAAAHRDVHARPDEHGRDAHARDVRRDEHGREVRRDDGARHDERAREDERLRRERYARYHRPEDAPGAADSSDATPADAPQPGFGTQLLQGVLNQFQNQKQ